VQAPLILIAMLSRAAKANTFGRSANGSGGGGWLERLLQSEMVDHHPRVGVSRRQLRGLLQPSPTQQVDRQGMLRRGGQSPVEAGVGGVGRNLVSQHNPDTDRALDSRPVGDRIGHCGIGRVDRLDQPEPAGCAA